MATDKLVYTLRLHASTYEKIKAIAETERRSMAMQIEMAVDRFIADYEREHGTVEAQKKD